MKLVLSEQDTLKNSSISDEIIKYANYLFVIISLDDKKLEKYSR